MERRRSGSSSDGSRGMPLARIFKGEQPLKGKPRPPAPIKNQQAISLRFFPGPYGSACVQHAEPSLAETRCIANKLRYRKISHCLVHSQNILAGDFKCLCQSGIDAVATAKYLMSEPMLIKKARNDWIFLIVFFSVQWYIRRHCFSIFTSSLKRAAFKRFDWNKRKFLWIFLLSPHRSSVLRQ